MAIFKDSGIVLRETATNESDKRVTLLLKTRGKLTVSARGARKPNSKFAGATQLFAYGEYILLEKDGFYSLTQAETLENFHAVRANFDAFCQAAYFTELADAMLLREMQVREPLRLLLRGLQALARGVPDAGLVGAMYTYKLMQLEGYAPNVDDCTVCGEAYDGTRYFFTGDGLCCRACAQKEDTAGASIRKIPVDDAAVRALRAMLGMDIEPLFRMNTSDELRRALEHTARLFREENLDVHLKSLELIERSMWS